MAQASVSEPGIALAWVADGEDSLYEIVNGQRVEKPMSVSGTRIGFLLARHLDLFAEARRLGRAVHEVLFGLRLPGDLQRRPDAAFVSYQGWAKNRPLPHTDPWPVVPELAAEVISKNNLAEELLDRIQEYFDAGVQLVWVVYPKQRLVYAYESPTRIQVLSQEQELDGGTVLPGFKLLVAALFEPQGDSAGAANP
jgi:Uma2 family endonuclease